MYSCFRQNIKRSDLYQYRLQAWTITDMQEMYLPDFAQSKLKDRSDLQLCKILFASKFSDWRNLITYCYIHNDSTVELSKCGTMIASFEVASTEKIISKTKNRNH